MVPIVNTLTETSYMVSGVPCLLTWRWCNADVAIKILLKNYLAFFKWHFSILINKKLKQKNFNSSILILKNKKPNKNFNFLVLYDFFINLIKLIRKFKKNLPLDHFSIKCIYFFFFFKCVSQKRIYFKNHQTTSFFFIIIIRTF